jgi:hypothetical protein
MSKAGGRREGAGRKPDLVKKERLTLSVPIKYKVEITEKLKAITKAYIERCRAEL